MSKKIIKPHFRIHKINGHPSFIFSETGDEYKYIGLTHAEITQGIRNVKLHVNPNLNDNRYSYMRPFSTHDKKTNFKTRRLKGYKLKKADKKTARKIKKNYKK